MNEKKPGLDSEKVIAWILAAICLGGYLYFDIGTRWKLSGTWECRQENNGATTVEKFGLFGSQNTANTSGLYAGTQIFGSYRLDGMKLKTVSKSIKRADGEIREFDEIQWSHISWDIEKLTKDVLSYTAKNINVQCTKQD